MRTLLHIGASHYVQRNKKKWKKATTTTPTTQRGKTFLAMGNHFCLLFESLMGKCEFFAWIFDDLANDRVIYTASCTHMYIIPTIHWTKKKQKRMIIVCIIYCVCICIIWKLFIVQFWLYIVGINFLENFIHSKYEPISLWQSQCPIYANINMWWIWDSMLMFH